MLRAAVLDDYQGRAHEFADWGSLADEAVITGMRNASLDVDHLQERRVRAAEFGVREVSKEQLLGQSDVRSMYADAVADIAAFVAGAPIRMLA